MVEEYTFESHFKDMISNRVMHLTWKAERVPGYVTEEDEMKELRAEIARVVGEEKVSMLINMARGMDIPIYEYCYQAGFVDGVRVSSLTEPLTES